MARPRKNTKDKQKTKIYTVSVLKDNDFDLGELLKWNEAFSKGKVYYQKYKKNVVFTFNDQDDAFKFKMRWEIA